MEENICYREELISIEPKIQFVICKVIYEKQGSFYRRNQSSAKDIERELIKTFPGLQYCVNFFLNRMVGTILHKQEVYIEGDFIDYFYSINQDYLYKMGFEEEPNEE